MSDLKNQFIEYVYRGRLFIIEQQNYIKSHNYTKTKYLDKKVNISVELTNAVVP